MSTHEISARRQAVYVIRSAKYITCDFCWDSRANTTNLSRTTEDSGTVIVPLVPWSAAGVFMAGTLAVPTVEYLPWAVMNYLGFVFALIYGATGIGIAKRIREDETIPGS